MSEYVVKKYAELDALILDALSGRSITFSAMTVIPRIAEASNAVAKRDPWGKRQGWRVVDRRLQALRKAGKVVVSRAHGWSRP